MVFQHALVSLQQLGMTRPSRPSKRSSELPQPCRTLCAVGADGPQRREISPLPDAQAPCARCKASDGRESAKCPAKDFDGRFSTQNDLLQGSLQAIIRKLDEMGQNSWELPISVVVDVE